MKKILFLLCALNLVSCYPMPTEEDYSTVPSTNNPDLTREKPSNNMMPGGSF
jgi:hypothetical protein